METRKPTRLKNYDYSAQGCYFITICTKDRENLFWQVGASRARPHNHTLSVYGQIVEQAIHRIPLSYPSVHVDKYVIMPNHIHLLISIKNDNGRARLAPTVSRIIQQTKGLVTKQIGHSIWQKSFYDEIIRNESHYLETWKYIDTNPYRWSDDEYYFDI